MTVAIIGLSLIIVFLCWKLIPLMIELGKLRNENETHIVPEIKALEEANKLLRRDIELICGGDKYVTDIWIKRIEKNKKFTKILEKMYQ